MNEQELRQALGALEVYKAQLEGITEQAQLVQMSLEEYSRAKVTLTEFLRTQENDELLVPVGGSCFVKARVSDNQKVLIGVGAGVTMEKSVEESLQTIDVRVQEMLDALKKLNESRQVLEMKSAQLNQMLQTEYAKMGQGAPPA